jgi:hypothetical protein
MAEQIEDEIHFEIKGQNEVSKVTTPSVVISLHYLRDWDKVTDYPKNRHSREMRTRE